jgi:hypothetical protein
MDTLMWVLFGAIFVGIAFEFGRTERNAYIKGWKDAKAGRMADFWID